jgi:hypothetical protein
MLLTSRTDTLWFQRDAPSADALLFWGGRLTFLGAPDPAPFPSVLLYWGPRWVSFIAAFNGCGVPVRP